MQALGKNGVLVLSSVTGGDRVVQAPAGRVDLDFVLGNEVVVGTVNANARGPYIVRPPGDERYGAAEPTPTTSEDTTMARDTTYTCRECGATFATQQQLDDHMANAHGGTRAPRQGDAAMRGATPGDAAAR